MITTKQYLIFEAEFISLLKRLVRYLEEQDLTVGFDPQKGTVNHDYLIACCTINYYRYIDDILVGDEAPNDRFNFGEVFEFPERATYRSTPLLDCEIIGGDGNSKNGKGAPISIQFTVNQRRNNLDYDIDLVLDHVYQDSQVFNFNLLEWRTALTTLVSHIRGKFQTT